MHHLIVTQCRVHPERMKEFFGHIQQWEHEVEGAAHPPSYHALYVDDTDPSRVLLLTHFESARHAERFAATGLLDGFAERVLSCATAEPSRETYDLYYAIGRGGPRVVFGEETGSE